MTKIGFLAACMACAAFAAFAAPKGRYLGAGSARGMVLELSEASAALTSETGVRHEFAVAPLADGAEGRIDTGVGGGLYFFANPRGEALDVIMGPIGADGAMQAAATEFFPFLREGVRLPRIERPLAPPRGPTRAIDPRGFVSSFRYWPAESVAWGYQALPPRFRTVIKLFPVVQAELIWRLCSSSARGAAVGEALAGQGLSCDSALTAMRMSQSSGRFGRFRAAADTERRSLLAVLGCADDNTRTQRKCAQAAQETSQRATSMETAGTAMARFR